MLADLTATARPVQRAGAQAQAGLEATL